MPDASANCQSVWLRSRLQLRSLRSNTVLLLLCLVARVYAQSLGGALSCATCHPQQALPQPETSMGRALAVGSVNKSLQARPKLTFHKGLYTYTVEATGKQSKYSVTDGTDTI